MHKPPAYVRDVVHVARDKGFLTKVGVGRAGGKLTPRARRLLERSVGEAREEMLDTTRALIDKVTDLKEEADE